MMGMCVTPTMMMWQGMAGSGRGRSASNYAKHVTYFQTRSLVSLFNIYNHIPQAISTKYHPVCSALICLPHSLLRFVCFVLPYCRSASACQRRLCR